MSNDIGPFQDIIEVGWSDDAGDTGWVVNASGATAAGPAEFLGGDFDWDVTLVLPIRQMGEPPEQQVIANRTVNWNRRRLLSITATIFNGSGYDSGGFFGGEEFETDVETILTDQSFYQKTNFGVTGTPNVSNLIIPKGPFSINLGLSYAAVSAPKRDPESTMQVVFSWMD